MRHLILTAFIAITLASLSGCGSFVDSSMQDASNKHDGSLINGNNSNSATTTNKKQCNQWCHNGWCSTHCEDVVNSSGN